MRTIRHVVYLKRFDTAARQLEHILFFERRDSSLFLVRTTEYNVYVRHIMLSPAFTITLAAVPSSYVGLTIIEARCL